MKFMTKYNLKRGLLFAGMMALPFAFGGCEKDNNEPNNPSNPDNPQKHNVELRYGFDFSTDWQNISIDTIRKYNSDPKVDTIFMIPENYDQFVTLNTTQLKNYVVPKLRERHNVNPNKVFGKGDLKLNDIVTDNHPEIVRFFADTLKHNIRN